MFIFIIILNLRYVVVFIKKNASEIKPIVALMLRLRISHLPIWHTHCHRDNTCNVMFCFLCFYFYIFSLVHGQTCIIYPLYPCVLPCVCKFIVWLFSTNQEKMSYHPHAVCLHSPKIPLSCDPYSHMAQCRLLRIHIRCTGTSIRSRKKLGYMDIELPLSNKHKTRTMAIDPVMGA